MYCYQYHCPVADDDPSIDDKIYQILDVGLFPCFRLTNATNQIGCSGDPNDIAIVTISCTHCISEKLII